MATYSHNISKALSYRLLQTLGMALLLTIFPLLNVFAQKSSPPILDSLFVESNSFLVLKDSIINIKKDTLILHAPGEPISIIAEDTQPNSFYQNLKEKFYKTRITRELYDLLFRTPKTLPEEEPIAEADKTPAQIDYYGKVIGKIRFKKLNVFGTMVDDTTKTTTKWIEKTGNRLHSKTKKFVIRNHLMVKEGDIVDPWVLADNERLIRDLPFIREARMVLVPRNDYSDTVDLVVVTEDVWSISGSVSPSSFERGRASVNDRNFFGLGHTFNNRLTYNADWRRPLGYEGAYRVPNIRGSFISAELNVRDIDYQKTYLLRLNREFFSPSTKYAGGLELSRNTLLGVYQQDFKNPPILFSYTYDYNDLWVGKAFRFGYSNRSFKKRSKMILAGRIMRTNYLERPPVTADTNRNFHNRLFFLSSLGFSSRDYYKEHMVYAFGRTEDVPLGHLAEFTAGVEKGEFYDRLYGGVRLAKSWLWAPLGYTYGSINLGSFYRSQRLEQTLMRMDVNFFTNLYSFSNFHFRHFLRLNYTQGKYRFNNEYININNNNGIRGFHLHELIGTQRLAVNMESVVFTPINLLEFKVAIFAFTDLGLLNFNEGWFKSKDTYAGYGLGFRVRNENLAFNTFQFRLAYYPHMPAGFTPFDLDFSGTPVLRFDDFNVKAPGTMQFH